MARSVCACGHRPGSDPVLHFTGAPPIHLAAGQVDLGVAGKSSTLGVLVPYPHAVDDHQTRNAAYLSDAGAAVVIQQAELTRERLRELWSSLADRSRLLTMARAARSLAQPQAAATVAALCWEAAHG